MTKKNSEECNRLQRLQLLQLIIKRKPSARLTHCAQHSNKNGLKLYIVAHCIQQVKERP